MPPHSGEIGIPSVTPSQQQPWVYLALQSVYTGITCTCLLYFVLNE